MEVGTSLIRSLHPLAEFNCDEQVFSYVDLVDFTSKRDISDQDNVLWCCTKSVTQSDISWYGIAFDRRNRVERIRAAHPTWVILTDDPRVRSICRHNVIMIPSVPKFVASLREHVLTSVQPQVVGVTGSVGKTTCVALVQAVLENYGPTLRVYAKRITPLSLSEVIVNYLNESHRYVVMEYAMFYRWHIAELAALLPPTVGVLLNVESEHLHIDGIRHEQDIVAAKRRLLDASQYAIVEETTALRFGGMLDGIETFDWRDYVEIAGRTLNPFIKSRLQFVQIAAALKVKETLIGPVSDEDIRSVEAFKPVEHRLAQMTTNGRQVFFDGEVTSAVRLKALGDAMYRRVGLILHQVQFYGDAGLQKSLLRRALAQFDVIYISRDLDTRFCALVLECAVDCKAVVLYDQESGTSVDEHTVLFVHWGAYWRGHSDHAHASEVLDRVCRVSTLSGSPGC